MTDPGYAALKTVTVARPGLDNFSARYSLSSVGRFMSPDPYNAGADPTSPQSWNMYSYVLNNPLVFLDPTGMECVWDDGSYDSNDDPDTGSADKCTALGGTWVDHSYFEKNNLPDWSANPNQQVLDYVQNYTKTVTAPPINSAAGLFSLLNVIPHSLVCWLASPLIQSAHDNKTVQGFGVGGSAALGLGAGISGG